jgi:hypothetical protein
MMKIAVRTAVSPVNGVFSGETLTSLRLTKGHENINNDLFSEQKVRKGYHCIWRIHYYSVLHVKYRKVLLDSEVTNISWEIMDLHC